MDNRRHLVVDSRVTLASGGYGKLGLPSLNSLSDSGLTGMDWSLCTTVATGTGVQEQDSSGIAPS